MIEGLPSWIVAAPDSRGGTLFLGPRLRLLRVPKSKKDLTSDDLSVVVKNFEIEMGADVLPFNIQKQKNPVLKGFIICRSAGADAHVLAQILNQTGSAFDWEVRETTPQEPGLLIYLDEIDEASLKEIHTCFGVHSKLFCFGESHDGLHAGPVLSNLSDLESYNQATYGWAFAKKLSSFGFSKWPLSLGLYIRNAPHLVARAILEMEETEDPYTCVLIESGKKVKLWSSLSSRKLTESEFFETQLWSKGVVRNLSVKKSSQSMQGDLYIGTCQTPCEEIEILESNSGKGSSLKSALMTTIGEAVERFAAWRANQDHCNPEDVNLPSLKLEEFHPFGPEYEKYLKDGCPALPMIPAQNILDHSSILVPKCLIPFPYLGEDKATTSSTSGLAAYPTRDGAILRATLELLERQHFYKNFVHQKPPVILKYVDQSNIRYWIFTYADSIDIPIAHAFIWDREKNWISRGTGSGLSFKDAAEKALCEAYQIQNQQQQYANLGRGKTKAQKAYDQWASEPVVCKILDYLKTGLVDLGSDQKTFKTENELLDYIGLYLRKNGLKWLVANLPCPIDDWSAVRVLIPGLVVHGSASLSEGGRRLLNPKFSYEIPT